MVYIQNHKYITIVGNDVCVEVGEIGRQSCLVVMMREADPASGRDRTLVIACSQSTIHHRGMWQCRPILESALNVLLPLLPIRGRRLDFFQSLRFPVLCFLYRYSFLFYVFFL